MSRYQKRRLPCILIFALLIACLIAYQRVYISPVFRYRGLIYEVHESNGQMDYTAGQNAIRIVKTAAGRTVTISYEWDAPQSFSIEQTGPQVIVRDAKDAILLQGVWQADTLLSAAGEPDPTYHRLKNAWEQNRTASVKRPTPPNAAEALDIAMGINVVRRGKGLAPKLLPLSLLIVGFLLLAERSRAQSSRRWGKVLKKQLYNPAVQAALQTDADGEPIRDAVFSKTYLVLGLYILFAVLLLLYDIS